MAANAPLHLCATNGFAHGFRQVHSSHIDPSFYAFGISRSLEAYISNDAAHFALLGTFLLQHALNSSDVVLDVGGNHGFYSMFAARLGFHVDYFEPQPALRERACIAAAYNNISLSMYSAGVGRQRGSHAIVGREGLAHAGGACRDGDPTSRCMQVFTLDALYIAATDVSAPPIALIKIDNEGWEIGVLEGARELLRQKASTTGHSRVGSLFIEVAPKRWAPRAQISVTEGAAELTRVARLGYSTTLVTKSDRHCPHELARNLSAASVPAICLGRPCPGAARFTDVRAGELTALMERMVELEEMRRVETSCNIWMVHASWTGGKRLRATNV